MNGSRNIFIFLVPSLFIVLFLSNEVRCVSFHSQAWAPTSRPLVKLSSRTWAVEIKQIITPRRLLLFWYARRTVSIQHALQMAVTRRWSIWTTAFTDAKSATVNMTASTGGWCCLWVLRIFFLVFIVLICVCVYILYMFIQFIFY